MKVVYKHTKIKVDPSSAPVAIKRLLTKINHHAIQLYQGTPYSYLQQPFVSLRGSLQGTCTCLCLLIVYTILYVYVMGRSSEVIECLAPSSWVQVTQVNRFKLKDYNFVIPLIALYSSMLLFMRRLLQSVKNGCGYNREGELEISW